VYVPAEAVGTVQVAVAEFPDPDNVVEPPLVQDSVPDGPVTDQVITPEGVGPLTGPVTVTVNVPEPPREGAEAGAAREMDGVAAATVVDPDAGPVDA
jgi:hypothetical protein